MGDIHMPIDSQARVDDSSFVVALISDSVQRIPDNRKRVPAKSGRRLRSDGRIEQG